jgi:hypothetical protein
MPTLTKDRTAKLIDELRNSRAQAIVSYGSEHCTEAQISIALRMESILFALVLDLAGPEAACAINAALIDPIDSSELQAVRDRRASVQAALAADLAKVTGKSILPELCK